MANEQNLIPGGYKLTQEEQSKGGKASARARKQRKAFKQVFTELLANPLSIEQIDTIGEGELLEKFAISEELTPNEAMAIVMMIKAMKGDSKAFEIIRDTIGEKPVDKQELDVKEIPIIVNW